MRRSRLTDAQELELAKLWAEGYSAGMIAYALDVTRNTVVGVISRRKLPEPMVKLRSGDRPTIAAWKVNPNAKPAKERKPQIACPIQRSNLADLYLRKANAPAHVGQRKCLNSLRMSSGVNFKRRLPIRRIYLSRS
jgi:hypothetical protein